ncbi:MAG: RNA 3'-terminal phosphate cyclase [Candidatus Woesearchaeota archaeon]
MIELDGSFGEGGGQILRTALSMSVITQKAFRLKDIRKNRCNPGLAQQHLTCINAMQRLCNAHVENAEIGSQEINFYPRALKPQTLSIDIGTAGSITLLLQSLFPACILSGGKFRLKITGGTDVRWSMPYDYMANVLLPQLRKYADIESNLLKRGFYPKGDGKVDIRIKSKYSYDDMEGTFPFDLTESGKILFIKGVSAASKDLEKAEVAERQSKSAKQLLNKLNCPIQITNEYQDTLSAGSAITLWAIFSKKKDSDETDFIQPVILGADSLGERGKRAEDVGIEAAKNLLNEIEHKAPIDEHLGDNLIPFLAIFKGDIRVTKLSKHLTTNIYTVEKFLGKTFDIDEKNKIISVK